MSTVTPACVALVPAVRTIAALPGGTLGGTRRLICCRPVVNPGACPAKRSVAGSPGRASLHPSERNDRIIVFQLMPRNQTVEEPSSDRSQLLARLDPSPERQINPLAARVKTSVFVTAAGRIR